MPGHHSKRLIGASVLCTWESCPANSYILGHKHDMLMFTLLKTFLFPHEVQVVAAVSKYAAVLNFQNELSNTINTNNIMLAFLRSLKDRLTVPIRYWDWLCDFQIPVGQLYLNYLICCYKSH